MNDNINQTYAPLVELIETLVLFFAVSVHLHGYVRSFTDTVCFVMPISD